MIINLKNVDKGNIAMASVLLLYYHLAQEKGFNHAETVYIDPNNFDGFSYLQVTVREEEGLSLDIDEKLLREGAIIYLLCDLNDIIGEYDEGYLKHEYTIKIVKEFKSGNMSAIPEVSDLFAEILKVPEREMNYEAYSNILSNIYRKYIVNRFNQLANYI